MRRFRQGDAGLFAEFRVDSDQQQPICSSTGMENGSMRHSEDPGGDVLSFGRELDVVLLGERAGAGDLDGELGAASMPAGVRSSVAAKPQQPLASTRMPTPRDSVDEMFAILPFLVDR